MSIDLPAITKRKLLSVIDNLPTSWKLKMELDVIIDMMKSFVKATYDLEGHSCSLYQLKFSYTILHN